MKRELICIICPRGCSLTASDESGALCISGNACPRGEEYATNECTNPVRTVTATIRVSNRENTMVSVKTAKPVRKDNMMDVMKALRHTSVNAPLNIGDVVLQDIFGADIVVTKAVI